MAEKSTYDIRRHYEIEKGLADTLRAAPAAERRHLYTSLNNELVRLVPDHPMLQRASSREATERHVNRLLVLLGRFLSPNATFLEVGAGDCALSLRVASMVRRVYAVDVSEELTRNVNGPDNFELFISDGTSIPVPENSVDIAFSNQLMEHLHPDDARAQLANIFRALRPGGRYLCITPNRISGPHDVSRNFDDVATGFHLKEYSIRELSREFSEAGFTRVMVYAGGRGFYTRLSPVVAAVYESFFGALPAGLRRPLTRSFLGTALLGVRLVGIK